VSIMTVGPPTVRPPAPPAHKPCRNCGQCPALRQGHAGAAPCSGAPHPGRFRRALHAPVCLPPVAMFKMSAPSRWTSRPLRFDTNPSPLRGARPSHQGPRTRHRLRRLPAARQSHPVIQSSTRAFFLPTSSRARGRPVCRVYRGQSLVRDNQVAQTQTLPGSRTDLAACCPRYR
jgi:hypothetical protein